MAAKGVSSSDGTVRAIRRSLTAIGVSSRRKYFFVVAAQSTLSLLDLFGVALLGLLTAIALGVPSSLAEGFLSMLNDVLPNPPSGLDSRDFAAIVLALIATSFLLAKSGIAVWLMKRLLGFLARQQASMAIRLTETAGAHRASVAEKRTSQETAYMVLEASFLATTVLLGSLAIAVSDLVLVSLLISALFLVDPWVTVGAVVLFTGVSIVLYRVLGKLSAKAGLLHKESSVRGTQMIQESLKSYRELHVLNAASLIADRVEPALRHVSKAQSLLQLVAQVPKYVLEAALVVGAASLLLASMVGGDLSAGLAIMALFLAAGMRILPSILRFQVAAVNIRGAVPRIQGLIALLEGQEGDENTDQSSKFNGARYRQGIESAHVGFQSNISLEKVSFTYPGSELRVISDVSLRISSGQTCGVVGGSGAGKSTLVDLILGLHEPESGSVLIGSYTPNQVFELFPGSVGYVPQDIAIWAGSIRENVTMALPRELVDDAAVLDALRRANLSQWVSEQPKGLDTRVSEHGVNMSGGQRQRIGIARAIYSKPRLLILDEATSALDPVTEQSVMTDLKDAFQDITTVIISHRLAAVKDCDLLVYMEDGALLGIGTFEELKTRIPEVKHQVQASGLEPFSG